jgi:hypothetical protein
MNHQDTKNTKEAVGAPAPKITLVPWCLGVLVVNKGVWE